MARVCVYCGNVDLTKEHIISRSVLRVAFSDEIRNVVESQIYQTSLIDAEPVVKDVCAICNNKKLSVYDGAGKEFVSAVHPFIDPISRSFPFSRNTVGWFLKTAFNYMRVIRSKRTGNSYEMDSALKAELVSNNLKSFEKIALFIEGYEGTDYFWDENSPKKIQYFAYKSVEFLNENILVNNFRIKYLDTFLMLPADLNYDDFEARIASVQSQLAEMGMNPERIDLEKTTNIGQLIIGKVLSTSEVLKFVFSMQ